MGSKIVHIHDKFFKSILSNKDIAIAFFKNFLPAEILKKIIIESLTPINKNFITGELKESLADLIFEFQYKNIDESMYISLILEHKSQPEEYTYIQISNYVSNAYMQMIKDKKPLKPILPVVFYHGKKRWEIKKLTSLIKNLPNELKKYIPDFDVFFIDLGRIPDEQLLNLRNGFLASALLTQKYIYSPQDLVNKIEIIFGKLFSDKDRNLSITIFVYYMNILEITEDKFQEIIENISEPIKNEAMSTYELMIQKYEQKGIEKGIEKGVLNLYKRQFDIIQISEIMDVSVEKVKNILSKNKLL